MLVALLLVCCFKLYLYFLLNIHIARGYGRVGTVLNEEYV